MTQVATVTGPVDTAELGFTLPAEHLWADFSVPDDLASTWRRLGLTRPTPARDRARYEAPVSLANLGDINLGALNRDNEQLTDMDRMAAELGRFRQFGGGTVVDVTPIDAGRSPFELRRLAALSGVKIVMATGWRSAAWAPELAGRSVDDLAAELTGDIVDGRDGVHAGLVALPEPLDPADPSALPLVQAGARAARATGVPLIVTTPADVAVAGRLLDAVAAEGLALGRVAVAGVGRLADDPAGLEPLLSRGALALFESIGRIPTVYTRVSDHQVALALIALAKAGYRDQLLLSPRHRQRIDWATYGGTGLAFLAEQLVPYLAGLGAEPTLAAALTRDNPARFLGRLSSDQGRLSSEQTGV